MMDIKEIDNIESKRDFVSFVNSLILNLRNNPTEWENKDLPSYLEAVAGWTDDMDGFYKNKGLEMPINPGWKVFAHILIAAKMYE